MLSFEIKLWPITSVVSSFGFSRCDTIRCLKEEMKLSLAHVCMCYYYISIHNNREIYVQSAYILIS